MSWLNLHGNWVGKSGRFFIVVPNPVYLLWLRGWRIGWLTNCFSRGLFSWLLKKNSSNIWNSDSTIFRCTSQLPWRGQRLGLEVGDLAVAKDSVVLGGTGEGGQAWEIDLAQGHEGQRKYWFLISWWQLLRLASPLQPVNVLEKERLGGKKKKRKKKEKLQGGRGREITAIISLALSCEILSKRRKQKRKGSPFPLKWGRREHPQPGVGVGVVHQVNSQGSSQGRGPWEGRHPEASQGVRGALPGGRGKGDRSHSCARGKGQLSWQSLAFYCDPAPQGWWGLAWTEDLPSQPRGCALRLGRQNVTWRLVC